MDASRLSRVKSLLLDAQSCPAAERPSWLALQCNGDTALLNELEQLLGHSVRENNILDVALPNLLGMKSSAHDPLPPDTLVAGRYRILTLLSHGGFASVYRATDQRLAARDVVLKVLDRTHPAAASDNASREIRALASITDPGVVGVLDCGVIEPSGLPFLVTQFVKGTTLRSLLQTGPLPNHTRQEILCGAARALAVAHKHNILHLDLKPENIMVSFEDQVPAKITIIDFGISRFHEASGQNTQPVAGSRRYMAPEQLEGKPTPATDVFALGVIACELLTGQPATTPAEATSQLKTHGAPASTTRAIARALSPQPETRFPSATQFLDALSTPRANPARLWVPLTIAASLLALILYFNQTLKPKALPPLGPAIPVTYEPGSESNPSFSPRGERIYYSRGIEGLSRDIYFVKSGESNPTRLTTHPADDRQVVCSRDGSQIAFIRTYRTADQSIIIMPALGGPEVEVAREADIYSLDWSGDGRYLLAAVTDPSSNRIQLRRFDLRAKTWLPFLNAPATAKGDAEAVISPDSKTVAFIRRFNASSSDLFTVSIDSNLNPTSQPRQITFNQTRKRTPQWTPDSKELVFASGSLGLLSVWRINASGGEPIHIEGIPNRNEGLAIPKDAWKLAYAIDLTDVNIWRLDLATAAGPVTNSSQVAASSYDDEEAHLSPDGRQILFTSFRTGREQTWVANADGANPRQLTTFTSSDTMSTNWLPDSRHAVIGVNAKADGFHTVVQRVVDGKQTMLIPNFFAIGVTMDGRHLLGRSNQTGQTAIYKYNLDSHKSIQLTAPGAAYVQESPDETTLYYTKKDRREGIWALYPDGRTSRVIPGLAIASSFAVRAEGIYYIKPGLPAKISLHRFRDGKDLDLVTLTKQPFWGFDVSADGRTILYSQIDIDNQDIMLINNFR